MIKKAIKALTKYFLLFALWLYKISHLKDVRKQDDTIVGYKVVPLHKIKTIIKGKIRYYTP